MIHETLDGEVIVVNLDTGVYYSLSGVAAEIWAEVARGASAAQAVDELNARYDANGSDLETAVARFVEELEREQLIAADGDAAPRAATTVNGTARAAFVEPVLHKYTDMQELLLLDPIHEVAETGWPSPAATDSPAH